MNLNLHNLNARRLGMLWPLRARNRTPDTLPDATRADELYGPYYGVNPPQWLSTVNSVDADSRERLLRQEREREEELRSIRALLNAGVLINRLPIELLAEIFMQLRDESWDNPRWFNVLRVCRHWFYVAATAARLWRRLLVKDSTNLLRTGLARSKHVPVDVEIAPRGMYTLFPDVLSIITPHAERLRLLKLGNIPASHMAQLITFLNTSSMTALQYFQAQLPVATSEGIVLREANFPRLRKLLVSNLNVVAQQSLVSRFVTLDLGVHGAPSQQSAMSIDAFLNMISSLESIQELTLSSLFIKGASSAYVSDPTKRVHLRHLRKIQLTLDAIIVRRVFDAIVIPPTAEVQVTALHEDPLVVPSISALLPADRGCLPILPELVTARVLSCGDGVTLLGYPTARPPLATGPSNLSLYAERADAEWDHNMPADALSEPLEVLRGSPKLELLDIESVTTLIASVDWPSVLSCFPRLREITIAECGEEVDLPSPELLFDALDPTKAHVSTEGSGTSSGTDSTVPCPQLQRLRLVGCWKKTEALATKAIAFLQNRRAKLGTDSEKPVLEELCVSVLVDIDEDAYLQTKTQFEDALKPYVTQVVFEAA
ncbi:hypothetical protein ONZ51_g5748 [Trametes cubensis]|uniref:F-box domain-containing protein n=1 Tax=Trametes cubensis TaxID=1111947 RepID=A0AAD7TTG9_9APHY|nr:hypothetical protein ONZ51_g5748 [Trametes cubensis]